MGRLPEIMAGRGWEWWGLRWALRLAHVVVVLDKDSEAALKQLLPEARVVRLPNAIDLAPVKSEIPRLEKKTVLFAAHVAATKGARELLEAWRELCPKDWCLRLAGLGNADYKKELIGIVGPDADVKFLGDLSHAHVLGYMQAADVFVLPTYTEGFPNVILEAMAAGRAIISTRVGAIPEMLEADSPEPCGIVIEPRDTGALTKALRLLISDLQLREALGRRAVIKLNRSYTTEIVFGDLLSLWRRARRDGQGNGSKSSEQAIADRDLAVSKLVPAAGESTSQLPGSGLIRRPQNA